METYILAHVLQGAKVIGVGGIPDLSNAKELFIDLELDTTEKIVYRLYIHKAEPLNENRGDVYG
ncbi:MAG: hypothetical protein J7L34_01550 [Thermotogaceae bacterium]|nr:hypothetical protein [Thermotogaceae bacterium]